MTERFVAASTARSSIHASLRHCRDRAPAVCRGLGRWTLLWLTLSAVSPALAQENAPLAKLLHDARDFRVRVRAAFVIGNSGQPQSAASLEQALSDPHPAVRAAAATALGHVGTLESVPALRRAERDVEEVVRAQAATAISQIHAAHPVAAIAPRAVMASRPSTQPSPVSLDGKRYVVVVGNMANRSEYQDSAAVQVLFNEVLAAMRESSDVAAFGGSDEITSVVARQIRERALPVLRLEGNLVRVTRRDGSSEVSVRCEVSIMIMDERQRAVRGAVSGAASRAESPSARREEQQRRLAEQSLVRAVRSALSNVGQAFAAAAAQGVSSSVVSDEADDARGSRVARSRRKRS